MTKTEDHEGYGELYKDTIASDPVKEAESLKSRVLSSLPTWEEEETNERGQYLLEPETSIRILVFTASVGAIVEELSVIALREKIISSEHEKSKNTNEFLEERLSQSVREELLFRSGVIGSGLRGEMKTARTFRNRIIHNSSERKFVEDGETIEAQMNRGCKIVEKLWSQITE